MPGSWWRFLRRRVLAGVRVVVYTRQHCPLCDEAADFLESERSRQGFSLDFVDVDDDATLREKYGDCVPVVEVDGKVRFRGHVNPVLWWRLVDALMR